MSSICWILWINTTARKFLTISTRDRIIRIIFNRFDLWLVNSPRSVGPFWQVPLETCGRKTGLVSSPFILIPGLECSPTMNSQLGMLKFSRSFSSIALSRPHFFLSRSLSPLSLSRSVSLSLSRTHTHNSTTELSRNCIIVSWHSQPNSMTIKKRRMKFLLSSCHAYDSTSCPSISCLTRMSLLITFYMSAYPGIFNFYLS